MLLLDATREANVSQVAISVLNWSHSLQCISHCELDAMHCRGLSKCLHLINQHRRIVGVWILNPWGEEVRGLAQVLVQAAVFCLRGEGTPSDP